jgi:thioredoxin 1
MFNFIKRLFGDGNATAAFTNLNATDFNQKMAQNTEGSLLDVRAPAEYSSGHLPKAINANVMSSDLATKTANLDKSKPVFVYCKSGARSAMACKTLAKQGFTEVYNLSGGIMGWTGKVVK